jgi:trafficking protein particle complex subunit 13
LASAWEPFYSNSPSFSAHSTASVLSLQGSNPLPGHPKTLRDLTNASTLLTLPSSFGAIQLGETFSSALAVNNESAAMVDGVCLRVEMQTASNKVLLAEMGGPTLSLVAGDTLEASVHHEIKELGQHVLACTVSYQLPPGARRPATSATTAGGSAGTDEEDDGAGLQTFRKFYKFAVRCCFG